MPSNLSLFDIGLIAFSIVGFMGLVQILCVITSSCIPLNRINAAQITFDRAYDLFLCAHGEGLIAPSAFGEIKAQFQTERAEIDDAQGQILRLDGPWRHFLSMFGGVASNLKTIEINLKKLTLDITYIAQVARQELEKDRRRHLDPKSNTDHTILLLQTSSNPISPS